LATVESNERLVRRAITFIAPDPFLERTLGDLGMWTLSEPLIFWLTVAAQLIGVASFVAMHVSRNGKRQMRCHQLFYATLGGLALLAALSVGVSAGSWVASGTTLSFMAIGATFDTRYGERDQSAF
jgi:hypothetical protein